MERQLQELVLQTGRMTQDSHDMQRRLDASETQLSALRASCASREAEPRGPPEDVAAPGLSEDMLELRRALAEAAACGRLEAARQEFKASLNERPRADVFKSLEQAADSGRLDEVLEGALQADRRSPAEQLRGVLSGAMDDPRAPLPESSEQASLESEVLRLARSVEELRSRTAASNDGGGIGSWQAVMCLRQDVDSLRTTVESLSMRLVTSGGGGCDPAALNEVMGLASTCNDDQAQEEMIMERILLRVDELCDRLHDVEASVMATSHGRGSNLQATVEHLTTRMEALGDVHQRMESRLGDLFTRFDAALRQ